jgi:serine/threonine protein kinase
MSLTSGTRLGPYEILGQLGAGGMGEVYKARDLRLNRTVAIKVLPVDLAAHPERRQRLEREALAVSSLNHPHICALYDIGRQDGVDFLVLEYLEGETLAARLRKGPMPHPLALRCAIEIAGALHQAHRRGIVHRDLKPANVMLTASGIKLLDFGLAKQPAAGLRGDDGSATLAAELTSPGTILGTLPYMAPEQLEGKETDARTDIFAFGAVLYEMITGQQAFRGASQANLISAIITSNPPPLAPPALDRVVRTCLAKDPDERWQSAADLARELQWLTESGPRAETAPPRKPVVWMATTASAVLTLLAVSWLHFSERPPEPRSLRFTIPTEAGLPSRVSISPDGMRVAFTGQNAQGTIVLWVRSLDQPNAQWIPGTDGAAYPFWAPDSRQIAFFAVRALKKVDLAGGQPHIICDGLKGELGGDWGRDGSIIFSQDGNARGGIYRVSSNGGVPVQLTSPDNPDVGHAYPILLPDGRHFLYLKRGYMYREAKSFAVVASLDSKQEFSLLEVNSNAVYSPASNTSSPHLLFVRNGALMAQELDPANFRLRGEPSRIVDTVATDGVYHFSDMSASETGTLAFNSAAYLHELVWFDRSGNRLGAGTPAEKYAHPRLTSDSKQALFERIDPGGTDFSLWKLNVERGEVSLLQKGVAGGPVPFPEGRSVVFRCMIGGRPKICRTSTGGAGRPEVFRDAGELAYPVDISPDSRFMSYSIPAPPQIWIQPLTGDRPPFRLDPNESYQRHGTFAPNGRWIAYTSNETGDMEVYVQPFPATGEKWKVSSNGGAQPTWRRDCAELFYRTVDGRMMAVALKTAPKFEAGAPRMLFRSSADPLYPNLGFSYAVTADGQRFLVNTAMDVSRASPITVITNWQNLLKR